MESVYKSTDIPISICPTDYDDDGIIDNLDLDTDNDAKDALKDVYKCLIVEMYKKDSSFIVVPQPLPLKNIQH